MSWETFQQQLNLFGFHQLTQGKLLARDANMQDNYLLSNHQIFNLLASPSISGPDEGGE
jgi:hypothetical protein